MRPQAPVTVLASDHNHQFQPPQGKSEQHASKSQWKRKAFTEKRAMVQPLPRPAILLSPLARPFTASPLRAPRGVQVPTPPPSPDNIVTPLGLPIQLLAPPGAAAMRRRVIEPHESAVLANPLELPPVESDRAPTTPRSRRLASLRPRKPRHILMRLDDGGYLEAFALGDPAKGPYYCQSDSFEDGPAPLNQGPIFQVGKNLLWDVEAIVGHRVVRRGNKRTFKILVKWAGWVDPTWVPLSYVAKLPLFEEYWQGRGAYAIKLEKGCTVFRKACRSVSWGVPVGNAYVESHFEECLPQLRKVITWVKEGDWRKFAAFKFAGPELSKLTARDDKVVLVGDLSHTLSGAFDSGAGFAMEDG
ncbi:uncharacterized protein B0H18DRAFT_959621 [Fomitopsis serialis]|uniref:uncharacterized protein n=1 Tax=Fomitopsis serialis TaxID=139415 RepID=UPI00200797A9|nr:uncharacterized protein B0H18DRAFT_959621 [Neoantrodia serialis]KAH9914841.1 hypothetical protein B0H18DRAFT_959621 [Neoantrodia serialis]